MASSSNRKKAGLLWVRRPASVQLANQKMRIQPLLTHSIMSRGPYNVTAFSNFFKNIFL